jgi:hypothetical protein
VRGLVTKFEKWLLTVFFIELFVGGGGRLIDFGVLSIRQVLFLLVVATFLFRIIKTRAFFDKKVNTFLLFDRTAIAIYMLMGWFVVSAVIGAINGNALSVIVMDFLRVAFFALYFPLAYYISKDRYEKETIITILKYSSLGVAVFTIVISLLGKTVFSSNFASYYYFLNDVMNDDLFFRPSHSVFYKSHFFVLMGVFLSLNALLSRKHSKLDIANVVLGLISIVWSETRGFLLALMFGIMFIVFLDVKTFTDAIRGLKNKFLTVVQSKVMMRKIAVSLMIVAAVPFMYKYMTIERFGQDVAAPTEEGTESSKGDKAEQEINDVSVNARLDFILASKDLVFKSVPAFVVGSGYGTEIAGRDTGIEMSFLDILVEQGIIGLALWLYVCFILYYNYHMYYVKKGVPDTNDVSLLACIAALGLLTNINPFINNPLGIGFLLIVLVLSKRKAESIKTTA